MNENTLPELEIHLYRNEVRSSYTYAVGFGGDSGDPSKSGVTLEKFDNGTWEILIFRKMKGWRIDTITRPPSEDLLIMLRNAKTMPNYVIIDKLIEEYPEIESVF